MKSSSKERGKLNGVIELSSHLKVGTRKDTQISTWVHSLMFSKNDLKLANTDFTFIFASPGGADTVRVLRLESASLDQL